MSDVDPQSIALRVEGLSKHMGRTRVLDKVSVALKGPGVLGVVGANGSGKSTLLRVLAGIHPIESGSVHLFGRSLRTERSLALALVGYAPEAGDVPDHLTVAELLSLLASLRRSPPLGAEAIALLDAESFLHTRLGALSLGQRRRASLLAAQVGDPRLLLLDEPTNGLDGAGLRQLDTVLRTSLRAGKSAVVTSHDAAFLSSLGASLLTLPSGGGMDGARTRDG